ncbi:MAG: hypothetical protein HRT73_00360 [Flavobacteriales bacterium]|nr:hypothetical protein [Flavobacteriales bacterium]
MLSKWGEGIMNKLLASSFDGESTYKDQYCEHPAIKHEQENMMELWNKLQNRKTRIAVTSENGTYKISDIQAYVFSSGESVAAVESGTKCGNPIATQPVKIKQYAIGTVVEVKKQASWVKATISKKDNMFDNRYYVNYVAGGGAWLNNDVIRSASAAKPDNNKTGKAPGTTKASPKQTTPAKKESATNKAKGKWKSFKNKLN